MKKKIENAAQELVIKSLDQLQGMIDAPVIVRFRIDDQLVALPVKRANPRLLERCRAIRRAVQPPFNAARKDYDPLDKKYLEERDNAEETTRALVVYSCCEAISSKKPSLTQDKDIKEFVQSCLTENILEIIEAAAIGGGLDISEEVQRRANFTFTPALAS